MKHQFVLFVFACKWRLVGSALWLAIVRSTQFCLTFSFVPLIVVLQYFWCIHTGALHNGAMVDNGATQKSWLREAQWEDGPAL